MNVREFSVFFGSCAIHKIAKAFARTNDLKHVGNSDFFPDRPENSHRMNIHNKDLQFGKQHMLHAYISLYTDICAYIHILKCFLVVPGFRFVFRKHQADAAFADLTRASGVPLGGRAVKSTAVHLLNQMIQKPPRGTRPGHIINYL